MKALTGTSIRALTEQARQESPRVRAVTIVNGLLQREIENADSEELKLELAQIKFEINQSFDRRRRG